MIGAFQRESLSQVVGLVAACQETRRNGDTMLPVSCFSFAEINRKLIPAAGAISTIVKGMITHRKHAPLHISGSMTLMALAYNHRKCVVLA